MARPLGRTEMAVQVTAGFDPVRPATRSRLSFYVLMTMTALGVVLSGVVVSPFVPGLVWALSLAIVAFPLHQFVQRHVPMPSLAAGISVLLVAVILLGPTGFVVWQIGSQATERIDEVERLFDSGAIRRTLDRVPAAARLYDTAFGGGQPPQAGDLAPAAATTASAWLQAVLAALLQAAVALFALFFLFRDRVSVLKVVRSFMPMTESETDYFFERLRAMTHATIYGTVLVSLVQGILGGLMFWIIGIPGALLWGVAMGLLSLIPSAGAFVIWLPMAAVLAAQGEWGKAALLGAWGALVVSTIDNLLYPLLVGKEVRMHTLPVFLSIVGGLFVFGAAGIVLGPVIFAGTMALLAIIRRRTQHGRSAVRAT
jgi:predicted PurR-regulated permease PerM